VQHLIIQYGYVAVFLLMLAESACIPIPSEVIMLFGGALGAGVYSGVHPSLAGIVLAGVLGNVPGSYIAWGAGRYAGQAAVRRWGRRFGVRGHDIDRAVAWFDRHGPSAVLFGRVVPVVRTFISLPVGFADMPRAGSACSPRSAASPGRRPSVSPATPWALTGSTSPMTSTAPPTPSRASSWSGWRSRWSCTSAAGPAPMPASRPGRTSSRGHRLSRPGPGRTRRYPRAATARTASAARCRAGPCGRSLACRPRPA
jgi:membrane protein YqaA with SNARE-associated domain